MTSARRVVGALALAVIALSTRSAAAQGFRGVYTRDGIDAIAVGDAGDMYRSYSGGLNWIEQPLGSATDTFNDVQGRGFNLLAVTAGGLVWRSTDDGGVWTSTVIPGTPNLHAIAMPADAAWYVAGSNGTVLKSTDGGATWNPLATGTGNPLNAVCFTDANHGWAAGDQGTLIGTTDGGATWNPVALPTTNALLSIDQRGSKVWVVGANATAYKSTNGGATFNPVDLKFEARADVKVVRMTGPDSLYLAGGGGFIRFTADGGTTWTFQQHKMHAPITDLAFVGTSIFATNSNNRIVMYSNDGGNFWRFPTGGTFTRSWGSAPKYIFGGQVRGSSFGLNPVYKSTIYCGIGPNVMRSRDDGETWSVAAAFPSGYSKCNAFAVSAKDSNLWLAAIGGASVSQRIYRTTDGGTTWSPVLTHEFGEYGIVMRADPDHPDTVYFGGENSFGGSPPIALERSTDFGATWTSIGPSTFRSPCDLMVMKDSSNVIIVADGVTGSGAGKHWKSHDYGATFTVKDSTGGSEIPGMASSWLRPSTIVSTNWSTGGTIRSLNGGETWQTVDTSLQSWGIDAAKDDPNVFMFGQYSGSPVFTFLSLDGGGTFTSITTPNTFGNNYSFYLRDRGTILAEQSSGIWKLATNYTMSPASSTQSLTISAPDGGESWTAGTVHNVGWSESNIALVKVEYRDGPSQAWQFVANVPGYYNSYAWTVPYDATSQAQVRVSDEADASPRDSSAATFTILAPVLGVTPPSLAFGTQPYQTSTVLPITLHNTGTATVHVTSVATQTAAYAVGRTTITLAAGQQDTIGVWFMPPWGGSYPDTVTVVSDDLAHTPIRIPLAGTATGPSVQLTSPVGGESWEFQSVQSITWTSNSIANVALQYRVNPSSAWVSIAASVPAAGGSYAWTVPYAPTATAQVRVISTTGAPDDSSHAPFTLTSSAFAAAPDTFDLGVAQIGGTLQGAIQLGNGGNAPLHVASVTVDEPEFWVGRTSFQVPAGGSDTLGVFYQPTNVGPDSTLVTLTTDDPSSPHQVFVRARGASPTGVAARPVAFGLAQNEPNPFGRATVIRYTLPREADVSLDVFDLGGQRVATLATGRQPAGEHRVSFGRGGTASAEALPAGVYFYRLQAGAYSATRKMLFVR